LNINILTVQSSTGPKRAASLLGGEIEENLKKTKESGKIYR